MYFSKDLANFTTLLLRHWTNCTTKRLGELPATLSFSLVYYLTHCVDIDVCIWFGRFRRKCAIHDYRRDLMSIRALQRTDFLAQESTSSDLSIVLDQYELVVRHGCLLDGPD